MRRDYDDYRDYDEEAYREEARWRAEMQEMEEATFYTLSEACGIDCDYDDYGGDIDTMLESLGY